MAGAKNKTAAAVPAMSTTTKRSLAKAGMAVSLGTLVATGLTQTNRTKTLKRIHFWSGLAMVGFSCWHASLYNKKSGGGA